MLQTVQRIFWPLRLEKGHEIKTDEKVQDTRCNNSSNHGLWRKWPSLATTNNLSRGTIQRQTMADQWLENDVFQKKNQLLGYRPFGFSSETLRHKSQRCSSCSPCKQLHLLGNERFLLQNLGKLLTKIEESVHSSLQELGT